MRKNEILVTYGRDIAQMAKQIAEAASLAAMIGGKDKRVGLKPNLVVPRPAEEGATTHPEIAEGLIEYLHENGIRDIVIMEGSWIGASTSVAFPACGYTRLADKYGVELVDTQKDTARNFECGGIDIAICETAVNVDFMINLPVMKGHCQTGMTCALKNNKGIIPDTEKKRFHMLGLHKPIAHLNIEAKNDFILVDGICGDLDFEEGGNPIPAWRLFAGIDPVLVDTYAAELMGFTVDEIEHITIAAELGIGSTDLANAEINTLDTSRTGGEADPKCGRKAEKYTEHLNEDSACSSCYASAVRGLSRLSTKELKRLKGKVCIGQGFRGKGGEFGVGACTTGFDCSVAGCPPRAADILELVREKYLGPEVEEAQIEIHIPGIL